MKLPLKMNSSASQTLLAGLTTATLLVSCTGDAPRRSAIVIDGSSTVYPITQIAVDSFRARVEPQVEVDIGFSGTGGGFEKFCAGETDINNASRPIQTDEMEACREAGVAYIELPVAFDALTVVVNPQNDWLDSITTQELETIWEPAAEGEIERWNQVRPEFPDRPLNLYAPGRDSGTFDYFTEAIVGQVGASREDYLASEDDQILVEGVTQDPNALGYFGFAYYEANSEDLKALAVDSGEGPVLPSRENVYQAEYQPLARPLFIYVNSRAEQENPALQEFVEFYLDQAPELVTAAQYIPLTEESYHIARVTFYNNEVGTVFAGQSEFDLTIPELQRRRAQL